jgi:hypothetical protein
MRVHVTVKEGNGVRYKNKNTWMERWSKGDSEESTMDEAGAGKHREERGRMIFIGKIVELKGAW